MDITAPDTSSHAQKTYLVSFCVRDYYRIEIQAASEAEALDKARPSTTTSTKPLSNRTS